MDSFKDVLEAAQAYCKTQMAEPTYNLYIDGLEPISFEDSSHITLSVRNDFICKIVTDRYLGLLKEAFKTVLGFDVDITLVVPSTPPHEVVLAQQYEANPASPQGNYEFTFENFIKGPSNQFAFAAAQAVAANPSGAYNPLFIYGGSGLGKTHLLTAIQTEIKRTHPDFVIMYVTCEQFTNELIAAIRAGSTEDFRMKYRVADLLLVDDIQFIAGKKQTQEEFFHTFNTLYESGRQIVLTSDRPPREMTQLEDRLQTRFEWGLMVDVAPPDFETRLAIIKNKAALLGVQLPDDISSFIAENLTANVRQIEGALNKLLAYRDLLGNQVDGEAVSRAVKDMLKKYNEFVPSPALIIEYICRYYDVDEEQVRGQGRKRDLMEARQTAMYLIRRMTNLSLNDIGKEFGDRDHTTVLHSLDQVEKKMRSDPAYAEKVKEITTNINNKK
jgi:chromosomal replication initiator protein